MLREGNIGASKLALEKNGFALPCYSDSSKVAYVLHGKSSILLMFYSIWKFNLCMDLINEQNVLCNGVVGIILLESEEKVIAIK